MNYRHAFHAGNHADVLKHAALLFCLDSLKRKPAAFAVLDSHGGPGIYDLRDDAAVRSPEWQGGVGRIWEWADAPALLRRYCGAVRAANEDDALRFYPGSPVLIATQLRESDRLIVCELHPEDAAALKAHFMRHRNVQVHARDGWEALGALLPFAERRGLVLIDPPYEEPDELTKAARAFGPALRRFRQGVFIWWRPFKSAAALAQADAEAKAQGVAAALRADLWVDTPGDGKLVGSSLFIVNPPLGLEAALREALPPLAARLATGAAGASVTML